MTVARNMKVPMAHDDACYFDNSWLQISQDMRVQRWKNVVSIDRMLRNHHPHEVLTHVEQNINWSTKTFTLALKVKRIIFEATASRESYLDEHTLRARVTQESRRLIDLRKNMIKFGIRVPRQCMTAKRQQH